ncbi:hypothetical protein J1N35_014749 [Gossypium stocksii]|uniref:Uncharacterized protein n=1 Tax=Gossypium stocksii TaxID=47602 RepID=A0A9D3VVY2_9ROSI|nr:hypothetical protein J1N35_014749 [Gossypium stocksii]
MSDNRVDVPELTSENLKLWKESILLYLGCLDIDYALRRYEPYVTETSTGDDLDLYEEWERSNYLTIMFIKSKIPIDAHGSIKQHKNVQQLLAVIWSSKLLKSY